MPQNQEEIQVHEATVNFESEAEYGYGIYNLTKTCLTYDAIINLREVALDAAKQIQTEHDKWLVDELSTINSSDFIIT